jgi:hypothetical protein
MNPPGPRCCPMVSTSPRTAPIQSSLSRFFIVNNSQPRPPPDLPQQHQELTGLVTILPQDNDTNRLLSTPLPTTHQLKISQFLKVSSTPLKTPHAGCPPETPRKNNANMPRLVIFNSTPSFLAQDLLACLHPDHIFLKQR